MNTSLAHAKGFRRTMIQLACCSESSFLAVTAVLVGTTLGVILAFNIVNDSASQSTSVPWLNLLVIFAGFYVASLLATFAPARRAARVYPAEALRYQ
jgi:putative ABC transport system permease protein